MDGRPPHRDVHWQGKYVGERASVVIVPTNILREVARNEISAKPEENLTWVRFGRPTRQARCSKGNFFEDDAASLMKKMKLCFNSLSMREAKNKRDRFAFTCRLVPVVGISTELQITYNEAWNEPWSEP
jgi:hypothetical protein